MTRINVGFPPKKLNSKHLLAEAREIKRIPNCISRGRFNLKSTPKEFTLGKGHVAFFYDKLLYLKNRYDEIYQECKNRNFNVQYWGSAWDTVPKELMNDWSSTEKDNKLIEDRIAEKLKNKLTINN